MYHHRLKRRCMSSPHNHVPDGHRAVGASGLVVSELGVGASTFGRSGMRAVGADAVQAIVDRAIDLGVTYFDLAEGYGDEPGLSETLFARALRGRREQVVIGTKFGRSLLQTRGAPYALTGGRKYITRVGRGVPPPAGNRLPRPVPDPLSRSAHADRRDTECLGQPGAVGQGAVHRRVELRRMADRGRAAHRP